jgi:hypothetical protein
VSEDGSPPVGFRLRVLCPVGHAISFSVKMARAWAEGAELECPVCIEMVEREAKRLNKGLPRNLKG